MPQKLVSEYQITDMLWHYTDTVQRSRMLSLLAAESPDMSLPSRLDRRA